MGLSFAVLREQVYEWLDMVQWARKVRRYQIRNIILFAVSYCIDQLKSRRKGHAFIPWSLMLVEVFFDSERFLPSSTHVAGELGQATLPTARSVM